MLHILGMIGKGIGIALLCILILLVILLLAVLFVPIRYRVTGKKDAGGRPEGKAVVSWFFHMATCFVSWEGKLHYGLKLAGISVYDNLRNAQKKEKKKAETKKKKKAAAAKRKKTADGRELPEEEKRKKPEAEGKKSEMRLVSRNVPSHDLQDSLSHEHGKEASHSVREEASPAAEEAMAHEAAEPHPKRTSIRSRLQRLWQRLVAFLDMLAGLIRKIPEFPIGIYEKLHHLKETADAYRAFLEREDFRRAFTLCKKQLLRVWKHVRPGKVRADLQFGFDDPSLTGQILAFAGMVYPFLGKDIILRPDFDEAVCGGKILIKGRITVFVLLKTLWILYFDKDIKRLIRIWKKEETLHGRQ